jgi:hypothetical protein
MSAIPVKTSQQKKNEKAINMMFSGLNDEYLRNVLLCAYAGQDESILQEVVKLEKEEYLARVEQMNDISAYSINDGDNENKQKSGEGQSGSPSEH